MKYIDVEGLTSDKGLRETVLALAQAEFPDAQLVGVYDDRYHLLAQLREGAGVQIITGPLGIQFWSAMSRECQLTVWPDGYDVQAREPDLMRWALTMVGAKALYGSHYAKGKVPTNKHKLVDQWYDAEYLVETFAKELETAEPIVYEPVPFSVIEVDAWAEAVADQPFAAIDFEWHRKTQQNVGVATSDAERNVYAAVTAADVVYDKATDDAVRQVFSEQVRRGWHAVGHGLRADLAVMYDGDPAELLSYDYRLEDTMGMAFILGETQLGLKPLSRKYLGRDPIENDREWADETARYTARYAAAGDTRNTYDLFKVFDVVLQGKPREVYEKYERPLVPLIASMEKNGVTCDISEVKRLYRDYRAIQYGLRRAVQELYGRDLDDDEDSLQFIVDCGFPNPGTLDQRIISLNPHWCIDLILEYRQHRTRANNFLKKILTRWVAAGKPAHFKLYTRFNQFARDDDTDKLAPGTGRLSSSQHKNPPPDGASGDNLQNQPRDIRAIYTAGPGELWWSFDFSALEMRIAAARSGDPEMMRALLNGEDMHGNFRQFILDEFKKDPGRPAAKTGNFEQLYEGGAAQLVRILAKMRIHITLEMAELIVNGHHKLYKRYHQWGAEEVEEARRNGYAQTLEGRRRYLPDLYSSDPVVRDGAERAAQNVGVQGTAADIVKRAMINVQPVLRKYGGKMLLQVHDELDGVVPQGIDVDAFKAEMMAAMEYEINGIKLTVEGGVGKNWAETH